MKFRVRLFFATVAISLGTFQHGGAQAAKSDREMSGLRGPVKTCVEERSYPTAIAANGSGTPLSTMRSQTNYDAQGRIVLQRSRNADASEWEMRYTYDASGKLLKTAQTNQGKPGEVATYTYDGHQRLTNVTYSDLPNNPVTYLYDEAGRKTKVLISRAEDFRSNVATAGSLFSSGDLPPNLPGGGTATTIYDESDRPTEIQIHDTHGELVSRSVRIYDERGNVLSEKQIVDDPIKVIPAEARAAILAEASASGENIREQLSNFMGGQGEPVTTANTYDEQGRLKTSVQRFFTEESTTETAYNSHGDVASQMSRAKTIGTEVGRGESQQDGEIRYEYQYDEHKNWTEKTQSSCSVSDTSCEITCTTRRTLTYF
jgi:YD repeat-containing protein